MKARRLLELLVRDFNGERLYWSKDDCLNSDGRRLLHSATKALLEEAPWLRRLVYRVRREPCIDGVERLLEALAEQGDSL